MLNVSLLGTFCIRQGNQTVAALDSPRLQSLLAYLILHKDAPQSRAYLSFLFWPDTTEAQARTNLRNLLHHLRRVLPEVDDYLDVNPQTLQWRSDVPQTLDAAEFEQAISQAAHEEDPTKLRTSLERVIDLYPGDLLPSCYDDWIMPQREALQQAYLRTLERLIDLLEQQSDYQAAIQAAQRLLRHDPLQEVVYRRLMRLHDLNGDRASALRVYYTCATTLQRELDLEPGAATRDAYEALLGREVGPISSRPAVAAFSPLVGRETEWAQLAADWRAVIEGSTPHVTILRGEAGIGKTRLVEEFTQWAARQGITPVFARCYSAEGALAYAPVIAWLRAQPLAPLDEVCLSEISRLLPEILISRPNLSKPPSLTEAWQRQRLFESLARAVLGLNQPLLLAIDDLQWCDRDTLEWLRFLVRFDRSARVLLIGAYRPEEVAEGHPLNALLQALRVDGLVTEIDLQPLPEEDTRTLASLVAGEEIGADYARFLYRETEGNPLFVVETVRAGAPFTMHKSKDDPSAGREIFSPGLPPRVQAVLEARLAQVTPPARALAGLAAVIGREFTFKLLSKAGGCDDDTLVRQLDELWQHRIIREHGLDAYDFSHDKLREVAYTGLSAARRRLLHHQAARALIALYPDDSSPVSRQLAAHFEQAGNIEQAIPYYQQAAEAARQVFSNEEAITLLQHALSLLTNLPPAGTRPADNIMVGPQLYESLGDTLELTTRHEEAISAYRSARALVPPESNIWQARLYRKSATAQKEYRSYAKALESCKLAEEVLGPPSADEGAWWEEWLDVQVELAWAYYWLARWPEMDRVMKRVQPVVQLRGSSANRVRLIWVTSLMHLRRDRYVVSDEMLDYSREGLRASREAGDPKFIIFCQFELGFLHLWRREIDAAETNLLAALELVDKSGVMPVRTLCLTYLTVLNRFKGDLTKVEVFAEAAHQAAESAQMPDYIASAKGSRAWLALRRGDPTAAENHARDALAIWRGSPLVYPFQWQALWPLIGALLSADRTDEAVGIVEDLLEEKQQCLPQRLRLELEETLRAKALSHPEDAASHLNRAAQLAADLGYL